MRRRTLVLGIAFGICLLAGKGVRQAEAHNAEEDTTDGKISRIRVLKGTTDDIEHYLARRQVSSSTSTTFTDSSAGQSHTDLVTEITTEYVTSWVVEESSKASTSISSAEILNTSQKASAATETVITYITEWVTLPQSGSSSVPGGSFSALQTSTQSPRVSVITTTFTTEIVEGTIITTWRWGTTWVPVSSTASMTPEVPSTSSEASQPAGISSAEASTTSVETQSVDQTSSPPRASGGGSSSSNRLSSESSPAAIASSASQSSDSLESSPSISSSSSPSTTNLSATQSPGTSWQSSSSVSASTSSQASGGSRSTSTPQSTVQNTQSSLNTSNTSSTQNRTISQPSLLTNSTSSTSSSQNMTSPPPFWSNSTSFNSNMTSAPFFTVKTISTTAAVNSTNASAFVVTTIFIIPTTATPSGSSDARSASSLDSSTLASPGSTRRITGGSLSTAPGGGDLSLPTLTFAGTSSTSTTAVGSTTSTATTTSCKYGAPIRCLTDPAISPSGTGCLCPICISPNTLVCELLVPPDATVSCPLDFWVCNITVDYDHSTVKYEAPWGSEWYDTATTTGNWWEHFQTVTKTDDRHKTTEGLFNATLAYRTQTNSDGSRIIIPFRKWVCKAGGLCAPPKFDWGCLNPLKFVKCIVEPFFKGFPFVKFPFPPPIGPPALNYQLELTTIPAGQDAPDPSGNPEEDPTSTSTSSEECTTSTFSSCSSSCSTVVNGGSSSESCTSTCSTFSGCSGQDTETTSTAACSIYPYWEDQELISSVSSMLAAFPFTVDDIMPTETPSTTTTSTNSSTTEACSLTPYWNNSVIASSVRSMLSQFPFTFDDLMPTFTANVTSSGQSNTSTASTNSSTTEACSVTPYWDDPAIASSVSSLLAQFPFSFDDMMPDITANSTSPGQSASTQSSRSSNRTSSVMSSSSSSSNSTSSRISLSTSATRNSAISSSISKSTSKPNATATVIPIPKPKKQCNDWKNEVLYTSEKTRARDGELTCTSNEDRSGGAFGRFNWTLVTGLPNPNGDEDDVGTLLRPLSPTYLDRVCGDIANQTHSLMTGESACWSFPGRAVTQANDEHRILFRVSRYFSGCSNNNKTGCGSELCDAAIVFGGSPHSEALKLCRERFAQIAECGPLSVQIPNQPNPVQVGFNNVGGTYWKNCLAWTIVAQPANDIPALCGQAETTCAPALPKLPPPTTTSTRTATPRPTVLDCADWPTEFDYSARAEMNRYFETSCVADSEPKGDLGLFKWHAAAVGPESPLTQFCTSLVRRQVIVNETHPQCRSWTGKVYVPDFDQRLLFRVAKSSRGCRGGDDTASGCKDHWCSKDYPFNNDAALLQCLEAFRRIGSECKGKTWLNITPYDCAGGTFYHSCMSWTIVSQEMWVSPRDTK